MISLQDDQQILRDPAATSGIQQELQFVNLATSTPPATQRNAFISGPDSFEPATSGHSWAPILSSERFLSSAQRHIIHEKFDVTSEVVLAELKAAATAAFTFFRYKASFRTTGSLTDITDTFVGDWWGATWTPLTMASLLALSPSAGRIFYDDHTTTGFPILSAIVLAMGWTAALSALMYFLVTGITRDPTFFGQPSHKLKIYSIAGYSMVPQTMALLIDLFFGILGAERRGVWHFSIICLMPSVAAAFYIAERFPLQAIGAFAAGFNRASAKSTFWGIYILISLVAATFLQSFFL